MFVFITNMIRTWIGGKTELGILVSALAVAVYVLPVAPGFTYEALTSVLYIVGALTGVALLGRVEDKQGMIDAFRSLFKSWRK